MTIGTRRAASISFNGVKVFSATMFEQRGQLGEQASAWIQQHPSYSIHDIVITQSSDAAFHCVAISIFYLERAA